MRSRTSIAGSDNLLPPGHGDHDRMGKSVIDDAPSFRVDDMPYGGAHDSGLGREGVRFAMEDTSEIRLLVFRSAP